MLLDGQPPTVAFTVLPQFCGPKANETEMDAALFTKNDKGRISTLRQNLLRDVSANVGRFY